MPNGTGNDLSGTFYIDSPDDALDQLKNPSKFKMDVIEIFLDHEDTDEIKMRGNWTKE